MFALTPGPIDADAVRAAVASPEAGAVVVFHGTARERTRGRRVVHLEDEAYEEMALASLRAIARETARDYDLTGIACVHRVGVVPIGEAAVVLATASPHRRAALEAVEAFVSRMKRETPIWKKEVFEDGAAWVGSPDDPQGERSAP